MISGPFLMVPSLRFYVVLIDLAILDGNVAWQRSVALQLLYGRLFGELGDICDASRDWAQVLHGTVAGVLTMLPR